MAAGSISSKSLCGQSYKQWSNFCAVLFTMVLVSGVIPALASKQWSDTCSKQPGALFKSLFQVSTCANPT
jgi:hypothetical protein